MSGFFISFLYILFFFVSFIGFGSLFLVLSFSFQLFGLFFFSPSPALHFPLILFIFPFFCERP